MSSTDLVVLGDVSEVEVSSDSYEQTLGYLLFLNGGVYSSDVIASPTMRARLEEPRRLSQVFAEMFQAPNQGEPAHFDPPLTAEALWLCGCDTYNYRESERCSHCDRIRGAQ